jgi:hypothetical protein
MTHPTPFYSRVDTAEQDRFSLINFMAKLMKMLSKEVFKSARERHV